MTILKVYKITNSVTSDIYVGSTKSPLHIRLLQHFSKARTNPTAKFHKLIVEIGEDKFKIELIQEHNIKTAEEYEQEYIDKFKYLTINSCNAFTSDEDKIIKKLNSNKEEYYKKRDIQLLMNTYNAFIPEEDLILKQNQKIILKKVNKKKWGENNNEHIQEYKKEYKTNNKDKIKSYKKIHDKNYYEKNKEKILEKRKEYVEANKDKIKEYKHQYHLRRK